MNGTALNEPMLVRSHVLPVRARGARRLLGRRRRPFRALGAALATVGGPLAVTMASGWLEQLAPGEELQISVPLYMVAVALAAMAWNVWTGVVAATLSFVWLLYTYTVPKDAFGILDPGDLIVLGVFLTVATGIAQLVSRLERARREASIATERTAFLADATQALSGSLGFHEALTRLARLAVPTLADLCIVDLAGEDGLVRTTVVSHSERVDAALADNLLHQKPVPAGRGVAAGAASVIATGEPLLIARLHGEDLERLSPHPRVRALLRGLRLRSVLVVPIISAQGPIGALTFAFSRGRRRYTPIDAVLVADLARRSATVLETVQVYEERARAARTLQRALLPPEIPQIEGIQVAARFHPASDADLIGGDFYDVFEVGPGQWAVVVGDVCGKGVEAAALTGLARHTIRAAAIRQTEPRRVLATLNDVIMRSDRDRFCTAVVGLLEARPRARMTIAAAGHPLPLRRAARTQAVEPIGRPGTLLGVFPDPHIEDVTVDLEDGDTVLFYTDGALDERAVDPERTLKDVLAAGGDDAERVAEAINDARPADAPRDDTALIVARIGCAEGPDGVARELAWSWR